MNLSQKVGKRIRLFRVAKNMTQEELAYQSGLHQSDIYNIENAKRRFNSEQLEKISIALEVPAIKFFPYPVDIDEKNDDQKLLDIISQIPKEKKKEVIDFLLDLDHDLDLRLLKKAIELVKDIKDV